MADNTIKCALCELECSMQISASHLRVAHHMTTKEYRALGHQTLSAARLEQLRNSPVGRGEAKGANTMYGPDHPNWKGGHIDGNGYKVISRKGRTNLLEHRVVAAEKIGRALLPGEVVHHIDGNRLNNHPDNLVVMTKHEHDNIPREGLRKHHTTGEDCERATHALHELDWSNAAIARALRVGPDVIAEWLAKPQDDARATRSIIRNRTPEWGKAARFLFDSGWTKADIARAIGIHYHTLNRWLEKN